MITNYKNIIDSFEKICGHNGFVMPPVTFSDEEPPTKEYGDLSSSEVEMEIIKLRDIISPKMLFQLLTRTIRK